MTFGISLEIQYDNASGTRSGLLAWGAYAIVWLENLWFSNFPIKEPRQAAGNTSQKSLKVLDDWAKSQSIMQEISQILYPDNKFEKKLSFSNFSDVQIAVLQAKALYLSYRFCREEYIYFLLAPIESFHDSRWRDKFYDAQIRPILDRMDEIKKKMVLKMIITGLLEKGHVSTTNYQKNTIKYAKKHL